MKELNPSFARGFHKVATKHLPDWLRSAHQKIDGPKLPSYSKRGIREMLKRRGVR
jgi:hypothetical protein